MRKIILSAGHSNNPKRDMGAAGNGYIEGELAVELRWLIFKELEVLGICPELDKNDSILSDSINYFKNIITDKSIVVDLHWNAASPTATGTEVFVPKEPSDFEVELAHKIAQCISDTLGIPLRGKTKGYLGVKTENLSARGSLGWMKLNAENILPEICFITNKSDMEKYQLNKKKLAFKLANILYTYANK